MTSREQFLTWWPKNYTPPSDYDFEIWQAGRQSMKDEAIKVYFDQSKEDKYDAIAEIQP